MHRIRLRMVIRSCIAKNWKKGNVGNGSENCSYRKAESSYCFVARKTFDVRNHMPNTSSAQNALYRFANLVTLRRAVKNVTIAFR